MFSNADGTRHQKALEKRAQSHSLAIPSSPSPNLDLDPWDNDYGCIEGACGKSGEVQVAVRPRQSPEELAGQNWRWRLPQGAKDSLDLCDGDYLWSGEISLVCPVIPCASNLGSARLLLLLPFF